MLFLTTYQWLVLLFSAFIYGFNKTAIVGSAIIATPLLLSFFPVEQSLGITLPLLILADIITLSILRRSVCWSYIFRALPWAFLGIVAGWFVAKNIYLYFDFAGDLFLKKIIAIILILIVLFSFYFHYFIKHSSSIESSTTKPISFIDYFFAGIMGILGGFTTMLANNGGPAWVVYLMSLRLDKKEFLSSAAWLFFIQNLTKLPFAVDLGFINLSTLTINLYLTPVLLLGLFLGLLVSKHLSSNLFNFLTQLMALIGSLYLLLF